MKIDRHISHLLYNHDCVIVPSFGGFLASYQASEFQSNNHTFFPPSKKIAFNVFLKNNDGLLASYVAEKEHLSYINALKNIEEFRLEIIKLLDSGKRIVIEDVGTLFYDQHKNLQFEPLRTINYLEGSYGLSPVQSPPVKREEQKKKIDRRIHEARTIRKSVNPQRVKTNERVTVKGILNTFLVGGALLWFSFNVYLIAPHKANVSSLNPFSYSSPVGSETKDAEKVTENASSVPAQKESESVNGASAKEVAPDNPTMVVIPTPHAKAASELQSIIQNEKNFFIIAGVFHEPGNAEKLVASLKEEGFIDAEIVNSTSPVKKVSYASFAFRKDAETMLQQLHSAKKDGWILAK